MRPVYFRSDFESDASNGLLIFIGIVIALCALAVGAVAGFEYRDSLAREEKAQAKLKPRPTAANPANLIRCEDPIRSREEVSRICRSRKAAI